MLDINPDKLEKLIVQEAVDQILASPDQDSDRFGRMLSDIRSGVNERIDKIFADRADAMIQDALDAAIKDGFEREYSKVNQWGKREEAGTTSISKELERLVTSYWSERVDRNGKATDSGYNTVTRAEYLMTQICADDFSATMKQSAIQVTGAIKDGMRDQLAVHMDRLLNDLFKVKSLQDQGKVEKPY